MAIKRIWHGWISPEDAEEYWTILNEVVLPSIEEKPIRGYRGIEILRRDHESETEFVTIMTFDSLQSVIDFQGPEYQRCYVPDAAQRVLNRWDQKSAHFEVLEDRAIT